MKADVVIVGAGIVGASIAWHLTQAGCRDVLLVEREAHQGLGATGRSMGGVRAQFATDVNIRLSQYSLPFYARFEQFTGVTAGYRPHGYLFVATEQRHLDVLRTNIARQRRLGLDDVVLIDRDEIAHRVPLLRVDDVVGGSFRQRDGFVDPYSAMTGFTTAAVAAGARLLRQTAVTALRVVGRRVVGVDTTRGPIDAAHTVLAAGVDSVPLAATAGVDVPVRGHRRMLVPTEPFAALPDTLPMVIDMATGFHFRPEGRGALLAWEDPEAQPSSEAIFDPAFVERILTVAASRVPAFVDLAVNPSKGWAGLYDMTPDKHAILGPVPEVDGLWLACGFSGHGVMHAPATGRVLADLLVHGRCDGIDWSPLSLTRFATGALLHETAVL